MANQRVSRKEQNRWSPTNLEKKCLRDLDSEENWTQILKQPRPTETETLGWRPFGKVFLINCVLFFFVLVLLFLTLEFGVSTGLAGIKEDWPFGAVVIIGATLSMAIYVTHLYRRSWNRRAELLSTAEEA